MTELPAEMTPEDFQAWQAQQGKKPSKFSNKETIVDGITYASKAEAKRGQELRQLEQAGQISELTLQPRYLLLEGFRDRTGVKHQAIYYVADFCYVEAGRFVVEDVKGFKTEAFGLKEKLFRYRYPEIDFRLVSRQRKGKARKSARPPARRRRG